MFFAQYFFIYWFVYAVKVAVRMVHLGHSVLGLKVTQAAAGAALLTMSDSNQHIGLVFP